MFWIFAIALLVFLGSGIAYWAIVLWPWFKQRSVHPTLSYWRQVLLALPLIFVAVAILGADPTQLLAILSPPAGLLLIGERLWQFIGFTWPSILMATIAFVASTVVLRNYWPNVAVWHPGFAFMASFGMFLASAEVRNYMLQQQATMKFDFDCVSYRPFIASVAKAGNEFQFDYHSAGRVRDDVYGWSFKTHDFYKVPSSVKANLPPPC